MRIVLFVKLKDGVELDAQIEADIRLACKTGGSDAHVPALIRQVQKIPYTRSGKKVELRVRVSPNPNPNNPNPNPNPSPSPNPKPNPNPSPNPNPNPRRWRWRCAT